MLKTIGLGLATSILEILRQYDSATVDFLAYRCNRERADIERYIRPMIDQGVIIRDGEKLSLAPPAAQRISAD